MPSVGNAEADSEAVDAGTNITFTCHTGYTFANNSKTLTISCFDGQWEPGTVPGCEGKYNWLNQSL